jgi:hypothetical protein
MRKRLLIAGVAVVIVLAGALLFDARNAMASSGGMRLGIARVQQGDDVYFLAPTPTNRSGQALELRTVRPEKVSAGLEFVEARVYEPVDLNYSPSMSWVTGHGNGFDPAKVRSSPVAGRQVPAHASLEPFIYLHFRVTGAQWPLTSSGVRFTYHRGLRDHSQLVDANYTIGDSSNP